MRSPFFMPYNYPNYVSSRRYSTGYLLLNYLPHNCATRSNAFRIRPVKSHLREGPRSHKTKRFLHSAPRSVPGKRPKTSTEMPK